MAIVIRPQSAAGGAGTGRPPEHGPAHAPYPGADAGRQADDGILPEPTVVRSTKLASIQNA